MSHGIWDNSQICITETDDKRIGNPESSVGLVL